MSRNKKALTIRLEEISINLLQARKQMHQLLTGINRENPLIPEMDELLREICEAFDRCSRVIKESKNMGCPATEVTTLKPTKPPDKSSYSYVKRNGD